MYDLILTFLQDDTKLSCILGLLFYYLVDLYSIKRKTGENPDLLFYIKDNWIKNTMSMLGAIVAYNLLANMQIDGQSQLNYVSAFTAGYMSLSFVNKITKRAADKLAEEI